MTQTGSTNAIVNAMLGWLKGLASWVLRLFNLSGGISPLRFLADNWLKLLVLLLIVGLAADLLVWLIRWRPHWVWFHKKRVIINDKNFFAGENEPDDEDDWNVPAQSARRAVPRRNWRDDDFVVAGAARLRREERARQEELRRRERTAYEESMQSLEEDQSETKDVFKEGLFNLSAKQKFSDRYEDEVFSVSNLPRLEEAASEGKREPRGKKTAPRKGKARPAAAQKRRRPSDHKR